MRHRRHNGFTLIEIVISLAILAVGLVALLALFVLSFDTASRAANLTDAAIYAQYKMEEIKRDGYSIAVGTTTGSFNPNYSWELVVTDEAPTGYLKKALLTINWSYRGRTFNEKFVYYLAKYAP
ncbi:MAG: prepilin-type N-terminal cleavage/methylation domain-containing protein [Candidatus Omnitrophota bacterium]